MHFQGQFFNFFLHQRGGGNSPNSPLLSTGLNSLNICNCTALPEAVKWIQILKIVPQIFVKKVAIKIHDTSLITIYLGKVTRQRQWKIFDHRPKIPPSFGFYCIFAIFTKNQTRLRRIFSHCGDPHFFTDLWLSSLSYISTTRSSGAHNAHFENLRIHI